MADGLFLSADWTQNVSETYEFSTDIFVTRSGREQRAALRQVPRRILSFSTILVDRDFKAFQLLLATKKADSVLLRDPTRSVAFTSADTSPASAVMTFSKRPIWAKIGSAICIDHPSGRIQATVTGMSPTTLTVDAPFSAGVPTGVAIWSVIETLMTGDQEITMQTDRVAQTEISAMVKPGTQTLASVTLAYSGPDVSSFNGRPFLMISPNWVTLPTATVATSIDRVDYGKLISDFAPERIYQNTQQMSFMSKDSNEIATIVNLFFTMRGRAGEFWCPSWTSDLQVGGWIMAGSSRIKIALQDGFTDVGVDAVNNAVVIFLYDGTYMLRKIDRTSSIGAGTNAKYLYFTESFTDTLPPEKIAMISWLRLSRFASDSLTINWITDQVAQIQLTVRSLETLSADA